MSAELKQMSIITRTSSNVHASDGINGWQQDLKTMFRSLSELCTYLELEISDLTDAQQAASQFPVRVTRSFADRIKKSDPKDPLLLQVLPQGIELLNHEGYSKDPLQEKAANPLEGLVHKYHGRVLLITTGSCAINCRYCFRRHFPYDDNRLSEANITAIVDYLRADQTIHEVIFSGGEPLIASDFALRRILMAIESLAHIKTVRFHTRMPVVLPSRINTEFVQLLSSFRFRYVMVIHSNHVNELSDEVAQAMALLSDAGVTLLNQSVLLKGINDSVEALKMLHERLFFMRVIPYYTHLLDKVDGAEHFSVNEADAIVLFSQLKALHSGYLLPRLVREVAGEVSKTAIPYD